MLADHGHVDRVERIASLPLKPPLITFFQGLPHGFELRFRLCVTLRILCHLRVLADVLRVKVTLHYAWHVRWHHLLLENSCPVDACTPGMILDSPNLAFRDPFARVFVQHQFEEISQFVRNELPRELELFVEGAHEHLILIRGVERRQSGDHLVEDGAK